MKLLILHGPPGVGKLTVARDLVELTGYKLLHNHLINDLLEAVFPFGSGPFKKLAVQFRITLLSVAAESGVNGVIMTFCYAKKEDDALIKKFIVAVRKHGGIVQSALLTCDKDMLHKRVQAVSRKKFGKIKSVKMLKKLTSRYNFLSPIEFVEHITIDNTKLSAKQTAQKIKQDLRL